LRIFATISSTGTLSFRFAYSRNRVMRSSILVLLMIRWLIDCRRWSAKEAMLPATYSRGTSCSSINTVVVDLYVLGRAKATTAASAKMPNAGRKISRFRLRKTSARSWNVFTSRSAA
jgi:hypothetical protein